MSDDWLPLRTAARRKGIDYETLRRWVKAHLVQSRLALGYQRKREVFWPDVDTHQVGLWHGKRQVYTRRSPTVNEDTHRRLCAVLDMMEPDPFYVPDITRGYIPQLSRRDHAGRRDE